MADTETCSDGPSEEPPPAQECPVCYSAFEAFGMRSPRVLPCCGALACVGCLVDVISDDEVCCPECFVTTRAKVLGQEPAAFAESFEIPPRILAVLQDASFSESGSPERDRGSFVSSEGERQSERSSDIVFSEDGGGSALSAFMNSVKEAPAKVNEISRLKREEDSMSERDSLTGVDAAELESTRARLSERARCISAVGSVGDALSRINEISLSSGAALPSPKDVRATFDEGRQLALADALVLLKAARELLEKEPNVLCLEAPLLCVGDLHGQYEDLLTVLHGDGRDASLQHARARVNAPAFLRNTHEDDGVLPEKKGSVLFLGDYVDRGVRGCEVFLYLLSLKLRYPNHIHLIRGNHESRSLTGHFGFRVECRRKYSMKAYHEICRVFEALPLAAKVTGAHYGNVLCCHGGIGPHCSKIQDINDIDRFAEPPDDGPLCDVLWADPARHTAIRHPVRTTTTRERSRNRSQATTSSGEESLGDDESEEDDDDDSDTHQSGLSDDEEDDDDDDMNDKDFEPNAARGCSVVFSQRATRRFLDNNNLVAIVRAHEVQEDGYARDFEFSKGLPIAPVTTVFSAPNYCGKYGNDAAVLILGLDKAEAVVFDAVEPKPQATNNALAELSDDEGQNMENHAESEAVRKAYEICPYMPSSFRAIVECAHDMLDERAGMVKKVAVAERRKRRKSVDDARVSSKEQSILEALNRRKSDGDPTLSINTIENTLSSQDPSVSTNDDNDDGISSEKCSNTMRPTMYTEGTPPVSHRKTMVRNRSVSELRARFEKNQDDTSTSIPSAFSVQQHSVPSLTAKPSKATASFRLAPNATSSNNNKIEPAFSPQPQRSSKESATSWPQSAIDTKMPSPTPPAPQTKPRVWTIPKALMRTTTTSNATTSQSGLPVEAVPGSEAQKGILTSAITAPSNASKSMRLNETRSVSMNIPSNNKTAGNTSKARRHQSEIFTNRRRASTEIMTAKSRRFSAALNGDAFNEMAPSAVRRRVERSACPHFAAFIASASFVDSGTRGKNTIVDAQRGCVTNDTELHEVRNALRASRRLTAIPVDRAIFEKAARSFTSFGRRSHSGAIQAESSTPLNSGLPCVGRRASESWSREEDDQDDRIADDESSGGRKALHDNTPQVAPVIELVDDNAAETKPSRAIFRRAIADGVSLTPGGTPANKKSSRSRTGSIDSIDSKNSVEGFSDNEVYALRLIFSLFDIDNSGSIDRDELAKYAEEVDECVSPRDVDKCLQAIDIDGDGCISLDDWVSFASQLKAAWQLQEAALGKTP